MVSLRFLLLSLLMAAAVVIAEEPGFRKAEAGYRYAFPRDHGSHPEFKLEWWYLTGHLWTKGKERRFGFQATFFRAALRPPDSGQTETPLFDSSQAYLAHLALLDVATGKLHVEERLNRQGWDAHASITDLKVHNGNWTLARVPSSNQKDGVSMKSQSNGAASHYVTFSRLATQGTVRLLGETLAVEGQAWMDHEFSSSQLGPDQVGWDWASIQLHDGREIMLYRLRDQSGEADSYSQLTWIDQKSKQTPSGPSQWEWSARRSW